MRLRSGLPLTGVAPVGLRMHVRHRATHPAVTQRLHARELRTAHSNAEVGGGQLGAAPQTPHLLLLLLLLLLAEHGHDPGQLDGENMISHVKTLINTMCS